MSFFLEGGLPGLLCLLLGTLALGTALRFAWRPHERNVAVLRCLSTAVVFVILSSLAATLRAVFRGVGVNDGASSAHLLVGLSEALMPAVVGFGLLGLSWAIFGYGARRLPGL